jgi:hypothetical protein
MCDRTRIEGTTQMANGRSVHDRRAHRAAHQGGAASESVEDGAEEDVSTETQTARAADLESQPVNEIASEPVALQGLDDLGDLPLDNDTLGEMGPKDYCKMRCQSAGRQACEDLCFCLFPNNDTEVDWNTAIGCVETYLTAMGGSR